MNLTSKDKQIVAEEIHTLFGDLMDTAMRSYWCNEPQYEYSAEKHEQFLYNADQDIRELDELVIEIQARILQLQLYSD